jgi:hypothetical protein
MQRLVFSVLLKGSTGEQFHVAPSAIPLIHMSDQNFAILPLPIVILVRAAN